MFIGYLQPILLPKIYSMPADSGFCPQLPGPASADSLGDLSAFGKIKGWKALFCLARLAKQLAPKVRYAIPRGVGIFVCFSGIFFRSNILNVECISSGCLCYSGLPTLRPYHIPTKNT